LLKWQREWLLCFGHLFSQLWKLYISIIISIIDIIILLTAENPDLFRVRSEMLFTGPAISSASKYFIVFEVIHTLMQRWIILRYNQFLFSQFMLAFLVYVLCRGYNGNLH
jgi:hypothetical protein